MKSLVRKVASLLPELESRGTVYLFALGEEQDINRWAILVSAAWSDEEHASAVEFVADLLVARLEPSELTATSGVVVIPSSDPSISEMPESWGKKPMEEKPVLSSLVGLDIKRAFVFKARRPGSEIPTANLFASTAA